MIRPTGSLLSVQYARAVAALMVVYAHLSGFEITRRLGLPEFGGAGVDIFFVISGFVMWHSARNHRPGDFALRRLVRVVPAYWFYTALLVLLAVVRPALTPNIQFSGWELVASLLFFPYTNFQGHANPILLQGWTLNYEMYFYAVFAIGLLWRDALVRSGFVVAYFLLSVALGLLSGPTSAFWAMVTSPMLLEFVLGMGVCMIVQAGLPGARMGTFMLLAGAVGIVAANAFFESMAFRALFFGLPAASILAGLIGLEPQWRRVPLRSLIQVGNASYSLYLCHPFVLSATSVLFGIWLRSGFGVEHQVAVSLLYVVTAVLGSCLAAIVSFRFLEQPASRRLNAIARRRAGDGAKLSAPLGSSRT